MARKLVLVVIACALAGSVVAACGDDDEDEGSGGASTTAATSTTKSKAKAALAGRRGRERVKAADGGKVLGQDEGGELDLSTLDDQIEQEVESANPGLDVQVECPDTVAYEPGSVFYCKLFTPDATYDVKCTQQTDGYISWEILT